MTDNPVSVAVAITTAALPRVDGGADEAKATLADIARLMEDAPNNWEVLLAFGYLSALLAREVASSHNMAPEVLLQNIGVAMAANPWD